jgi:hypothetical protein
MKVYFNNYRHHWLSPYTMVDYLFFWTDWSKCHRDKSLIRALSCSKMDGTWTDRPDWVDGWTERLVPISKFIQKVLDWIHPKIDFVKIDRWDTWSMDQSLGQIVLPMLRQLKSTSHGAPLVEDADVPHELKSSSAPPKEKEHGTDANHFKRWDWVLSEMIFAFESKLDTSWEDSFKSGEIDMIFVPIDHAGNEVPKKDAKYFQWVDGPNNTYECDFDGMKIVEGRIQNGFRLFGRYYQNLWD